MPNISFERFSSVFTRRIGRFTRLARIRAPLVLHNSGALRAPQVCSQGKRSCATAVRVEGEEPWCDFCFRRTRGPAEKARLARRSASRQETIEATLGQRQPNVSRPGPTSTTARIDGWRKAGPGLASSALRTQLRPTSPRGAGFSVGCTNLPTPRCTKTTVSHQISAKRVKDLKGLSAITHLIAIGYDFNCRLAPDLPLANSIYPNDGATLALSGRVSDDIEYHPRLTSMGRYLSPNRPRHRLAIGRWGKEVSP